MVVSVWLWLVQDILTAFGQNGSPVLSSFIGELGTSTLSCDSISGAIQSIHNGFCCDVMYV